MFAGNDISSSENFCNQKKKEAWSTAKCTSLLVCQGLFFFFFVSNYSAQNIFISSQLEALDLCTVWNVIDFNT